VGSTLLLLGMAVMLVAIPGIMVVALLFFCLGRGPLGGLRRQPEQIRLRLREIGPYALVLGVVLAANKLLQGVIMDLSGRYAYRGTQTLYRIEGDIVLRIQETVPAELTLYFSGAYVFGYIVLLTFPAVGYFVSASVRPLKTLLTAYAINYGVAIVCYTLVLARGPRNHLAGVDHLLVDLYPQVTVVTGQVNRASNVFPSLHASLSTTVILLAVWTDDDIPGWIPIAGFLAGSIVFSTMYLGIHWLLDVIAGVILATGSVLAADRFVGQQSSATTPPASATTQDDD